MPKKKTTIIEEETPQEENTPEIEYKDIKGKTFEEVATTSEPEEKKEENISKLKAKGLIRRVGPAKGGHWEVIGEVKSEK